MLVSLTASVAKKQTRVVLDTVNEMKEFKKVIRTRNNVLVLFINDVEQSADMVKLLEGVLQKVKGMATMITVDCNVKEGKKVCKKMKICRENAFSLKHYKDGKYHKDYERPEMAESVISFLKDPEGDLPWEEEPQAQVVVHLKTPKHLTKLLKTEKGPVFGHVLCSLV